MSTTLTIVSDLETITTDTETLSSVANDTPSLSSLIDEIILEETSEVIKNEMIEIVNEAKAKAHLKSLSNLPLREQEIERNLTDEELLELGQLISDDLKKMQELENEKKNYDSYMSNQIKVLKDQIFNNNIIHQSKTKLEYVSCYFKKNFTTGKREYYSTTTGELLKTEDLNSNDYQNRIEFNEPDIGNTDEETEQAELEFENELELVNEEE